MKLNRKSRALILLFLLLTAGFTSAKLAENWIISTWDYEDSWLVTLQGYEKTEKMAEDEPDEPGWETEQYKLVVSFLTGENQGETFPVTVEHLVNSQLEFVRGRKYILTVDRFDDGSSFFSVSDRFRFPLVCAFVVTLALAICALSGVDGTRAILGLVLSLAVLTKWALPMMLGGHSPLVVAICSVAGISALTVALVLKKKQYWPIAFLGAVGGATAASLLGWLSIYLWQLTGIEVEGGTLLASILPDISMKGILLASVIIGAIGAVLDVSISVTSTMAEMYDYDPEISTLRLLQAGLSVGQDILGSMINTLILAYFGSSLVISLLITYHVPVLWSVLNDPLISAELVRGLAGTAGLLMTVPLTALIGAWWIGSILKKDNG